MSNSTVIRMNSPAGLLLDMQRIKRPCDAYENPPDHILDQLIIEDSVHEDMANLHKLDNMDTIAKFDKTKVATQGHVRNTTLFNINLSIQKDEFPSSFYKFKTLAKRSLINYKRNPESATSNIAISFGVALLAGLLFYNKGQWGIGGDLLEHHNRIGLLFMFTLALWHMAIISADLLVRQHILEEKEMIAGYYTAGPYYISKFICEMLPNRMIPLVFYSGIHFFVQKIWPKSLKKINFFVRGFYFILDEWLGAISIRLLDFDAVGCRHLLRSDFVILRNVGS